MIGDQIFLACVKSEVIQARENFPGQEHEVDLAGWLSILTEEVGEVARALNERLLGDDTLENRANLQVELIQVAAMACMMRNAAEIQWPIEKEEACSGELASS